MALTKEDRDEIRDIFKNTPLTPEHIQQLQSEFVTVDDCNDKTTSINKKLLQDYTDLAVIKFQNKMILGILAFIGTAIGGYIIAQLMGVI